MGHYLSELPRHQREYYSDKNDSLGWCEVVLKALRKSIPEMGPGDSIEVSKTVHGFSITYKKNDEL